MADPGAPTVIVTGHPLFGYIKIRQRRRRRGPVSVSDSGARAQMWGAVGRKP
jgi:hypothetical protein